MSDDGVEKLQGKQSKLTSCNYIEDSNGTQSRSCACCRMWSCQVDSMRSWCWLEVAKAFLVWQKTTGPFKTRVVSELTLCGENGNGNRVVKAVVLMTVHWFWNSPAVRSNMMEQCKMTRLKNHKGKQWSEQWSEQGSAYLCALLPDIHISTSPERLLARIRFIQRKADVMVIDQP